MLQGVCSPFMLTTPIIGLASAASSSPVARMKARWGARSRPSVVTRDRHFFMSRNLRSTSRLSPELLVPELPPAFLLLQRRNNGRMLELGDIELRQHPRLSINVEHLLNRRKVRRGARIAAKIVIFQEVCIQHLHRR